MPATLVDYLTQLKNSPGSQTQIATAIWTAATRSLTVDPATAAGAANLVWTHASRTLTVGGGNVPSSQTIQTPAIASAVSMTSTGSTNILTFTGSGTILSIDLTVNTGTAIGLASLEIDITTDGVLVAVPVYVASQTFVPQATAIATFYSGTGGAPLSFITFGYSLQFNSSVTIAINVTATTLTTGAITGTVLWAHS